MSRFISPARPAARSLAAMDPFSDLQREMSRLVDDFLGSGTPMGAGAAAAMTVPRVDVRENPHEICVCAELPGVKPEAVDIRMEGNLLTIRGEKSQDVEEQKEDYYLMERSYGRFQRSIQLPYAPQPEDVHADFKDGVLTIHVPKAEHQERSHRIEIESQKSAAQAPEVISASPSSGAQPH